MDVDGARREILAVEQREEDTYVLGLDREQPPPAEGAHGPCSALARVAARLGEEEAVVLEGRGLGPALGPQVREPGTRRVVEEGVPSFGRLLSTALFVFGDALVHQPVGAALVELTGRWPAAPRHPATRAVGFHPGGAEPFASVVAIEVAPAGFVERSAFVCADLK